MPDHDYKKLLKHSRFQHLWLSQILTQVTIQIMNFYVLTRIFALTNSSIAVSLMWLAASLPSLIFGSFSGVIIDNFSRRQLMLIANVFQILVVSSLLLAGDHLYYLYIIVFFYWFFDQLYYPSQQASAPALVPPALLTAANGLFLLTQQASILIGFGLGGIFLSVLGNTGTILFACFNLALSAIAVNRLPKDKPHQDPSKKTVVQFWQDFSDGYSFLASQKIILLPFTLLVFIQMLITIVITLMPVYTQSVLGIDLRHAGLVLVIPAATGAIITTFFLPKLNHRYRKLILIKLGILISSLSLLGFYATGFLPISKVLFSGLMAFTLGGAAAGITVLSQSFLQLHIPASYRGRIYGQLGFLLILTTTLPLLVSATIADLLGISVFMGILGLILFIGFLYVQLRAGKLLATSFRV